MHVSVFAMTILLGFGIWTVAGEPRLKFTDTSSSPLSAEVSDSITGPAASLASGTAPGRLDAQN